MTKATPGVGRGPRRPIRPDPEDLALFHTSLAALCRADMPLGRALRLTAADLGHSKLGREVLSLADAVDSGTPIDKAYAEQNRPFPPLYQALVAAGVASGDLPSALDEISNHARTEGDAARRIRTALIQPVVTATCALVVGLVAVLFASPRLWSVSDMTGQESPTPIAVGALAALAVMLGAVIVVAWKRSPMRAVRGARLPGIGPLREAAAQAGLVSTLALLLKRDIPLHEALSIAASSCADWGLQASVERAADRVQAGEALAPALGAERACDSSVLWLVESAHGSHGVSRALDDVGQLLRRRFERGLDRFTAWLRPAAELVVGLVVLAFAYAYIVPLVRQANGVLRLWTS